MALPLLTLSALLNAAPPLYPVLELLDLLARSAEAMLGERPLILAVIEGLLSRTRAEVPALGANTEAAAVRVLLVDRLLPPSEATIPPLDDVLGLRRRVLSNRVGSSPIFPWCRKCSPPITSSGALGINALSCADRSCNDIPHTQNSCECPLTAVDVLAVFGPAVEYPLCGAAEVLPFAVGVAEAEPSLFGG